MDDFLVYGKTVAEHDARLENLLQKLTDNGVTLNPEKWFIMISTGPPRFEQMQAITMASALSFTNSMKKVGNQLTVHQVS